jgi:hypothetical protein
MPRCVYCGEEVDLPFKCSVCGQYYCSEHRLPESHGCVKVPARSWLVYREAQYEPRRARPTFLETLNFELRYGHRRRRILGGIALIGSVLVGSLLFCLYYPSILAWWSGEAYPSIQPLLEPILSPILGSEEEAERVYLRAFQSKTELIRFLREDKTNELKWTPEFTCHNFTVTLIQHAREKGYEMFYVVVKNPTRLFAKYGLFYDERWGDEHAMCLVYIVEEEAWYYIEPQSDAIIPYDGKGEIIKEFSAYNPS